jgi:hypothetical protein
LVAEAQAAVSYNAVDNARQGRRPVRISDAAQAVGRQNLIANPAG